MSIKDIELLAGDDITPSDDLLRKNYNLKKGRIKHVRPQINCPVGWRTKGLGWNQSEDEGLSDADQKDPSPRNGLGGKSIRRVFSLRHKAKVPILGLISSDTIRRLSNEFGVDWEARKAEIIIKG